MKQGFGLYCTLLSDSNHVPGTFVTEGIYLHSTLD